MLNRLILAALLLQIPAGAAPAATLEGSCRLREGSAAAETAPAVQIGDKVKGTCKFYVKQIFQQKVIYGELAFTSTADKPGNCMCFVAFFDINGVMLGCAATGVNGDQGLAAGQSVGRLISIPLPAGLFDAVAQYKIAYYESEHPIGTNVPPVPATPPLRRTWTMASGGETFEAELFDVAGDTVGLKRQDGQAIRLPPGKLSAPDQRFIRHGEAIATSTPGIFGEAREGVCLFKPGEAVDPGPLLAQDGRTTAGTCKFLIDGLPPNRKMIAAVFSLSNTAPGVRHRRHYVAFFDKGDALVGCVMSPVKDTSVWHGASPTATGRFAFPLPAGVYEAAVRYRLTCYESDREIGSEGLPAATPNDSPRHNARSTAPPAPPSQALRPGRWFAAGPDFPELRNVAIGHALNTYAHAPESYQRMLARSTPDSTIILLFSHERPGDVPPQEYWDLLPLPWPEIEAALSRGETVQRQGTARQRKVVLLAAPSGEKLRALIRSTPLLAPGSPNQ